MAKRHLFTHHSRIKPKYNQKNKDKAIHDVKYLKWLHEVEQPPCFICGERNGIELHHIKEASTDIKNDHEVIPLCGISCHRLGDKLSAHGTPRKFRERYPVVDQKLAALKLYIKYMESLDEINPSAKERDTTESL